MESKATLHVVSVGDNRLTRQMNCEDERVLLDALIATGKIVLPGLKRGDVIHVKEWALQCGEEFFFFDGKRIRLRTETLRADDGNILEELYWPEFPIDYWHDIITYNHIVPVRFGERRTFTPEDVKFFHLVTEDIEFDVPYVEIDNFMVILPVESNDRKIIVDEINNARHVDVVYPGRRVSDDWLNYGMRDWRAYHDDFKTDKTILVVIPGHVYDEC